MLLYHVTVDRRHNGIFEPRLPENVEVYDEDQTTPRICVSDSIEGCLSSMPNGGEDLHDLLESNDSMIKVFIFDTDKLNIRDEDIVPPKMLKEKYNVKDAEVTGEHWLLKPVTLTDADVHILEIIDFAIFLKYPHFGTIVGKITHLTYLNLYGSNQVVIGNACGYSHIHT